MSTAAVTLIDFVGGLTIAWHAGAAFLHLLRGQRQEAHALVLAGIMAGLSFKTAASVLHSIELRTWDQIGFAASIFALRALLKWHFTRHLRPSPARGGQAR